MPIYRLTEDECPVYTIKVFHQKLGQSLLWQSSSIVP